MADRPQCRCGNRMVTRSSRSIGAEQQRYIRCPKCGARGTVFVKTTLSPVRICKGGKQ